MKLHLLLGLLFMANAFLAVAQDANIMVNSVTVTAPVLKGSAVNPLAWLNIENRSDKEVTIKNISFYVNASTIQDVERLEIYAVDTLHHFSTSKLICSFTPVHKHMTVEIRANVKQHLWINAVLKKSANIDHILEVHATSLLTGDGRQLQVKEAAVSYAQRMGIVLRKAGENGVHTYRIPGLITTDQGTLIAVYDARYNNSKDLPGNIDIAMSRSTDGGRTWQAMKIIMNMGLPKENNGVGDPSILFDPVTKRIWVAALWSKGNHAIAGSKPGLSPEETGQFVLVNSGDDGITWSSPINITSQVKNPSWHILFQGPGNGIAMHNGTIVFPAQYWDENRLPHSTIIYSDDHGSNWKTAIGAKPNTTESQLVETSPGILMLNMRDNRGKFRSVATTTDMGIHWAEHPTSQNALPDPVCQGSFIKAVFKGKPVLFFSNPNSFHHRDSITIKASTDMGNTWPSATQLLVDERECYGYSALTQIDKNTIGILYEGVRELYFVRIPIKAILR